MYQKEIDKIDILIE